MTLSFYADDAGARVSPASVAFSPDDWASARRVTVNASIGEADDDGRQFTVTGEVASEDPYFASLDVGSISVTVMVTEDTTPPPKLETAQFADDGGGLLVRFDARTDVKVILATNKIESLDPALIRPGRIDRKIEFPAPDQKTRRHIFQIHTSKMNLNSDVDLEEFVMSKDELSGADIKAMCTEAGLLALRERRMKVSHAEFKKAREYVMYKKKQGAPEGLYL